MTYENYLGFSREVLLEKMRQILPEKRLTHCLGLRRLRVTWPNAMGLMKSRLV